jgi:hypothetical protein
MMLKMLALTAVATLAATAADAMPPRHGAPQADEINRTIAAEAGPASRAMTRLYGCLPVESPVAAARWTCVGVGDGPKARPFAISLERKDGITRAYRLVDASAVICPKPGDIARLLAPRAHPGAFADLRSASVQTRGDIALTGLSAGPRLAAACRYIGGLNTGIYEITAHFAYDQRGYSLVEWLPIRESLKDHAGREMVMK